MRQLFEVTMDRDIYALKTDDFAKANVLAEMHALATGKAKSRIEIVGIAVTGREDFELMATDTLIHLGNARPENE